jgi:fluoroquinolone transport system permease protein
LKIARSQRNNKIQGLAAVRGLGMLIAGLPCLPWFIHSGGALVFGVLPPFWAAKAFWVASDHGTWWPFLIGGVSTTSPSRCRCFVASSPRTPERPRRRA